MPSLSFLRDIFVSASPFAVWLLLTASVVAQQPAPAFTDQRYPGAEAPNGEKWITIRVVDRIGGERIPGAELLLLGEAAAPVTGEAMNAWRFEADDDGFLAARVDEGAEGFRPWGWLCARAPGYCQHMRHEHLSGSVIRLSPSVAMPVQVLLDIDAGDADAVVGVTIGEHAVQASGPVVVRGLAVGTHQVFVSAAGRQSAMLDVEVGGPGEARAKVALTLPAAE